MQGFESSGRGSGKTTGVLMSPGDGLFSPPGGPGQGGPSFSPPPAPPGGFPPPPPPGGYGAGPGPLLPPGAYAPPPQKKSYSACIIAAIGCGVLVLLFVIISIASCVFMGSRMGTLFTTGMKSMKSEYVKNLSSDHSDLQKQRFEADYDDFFSEADKIGLMAWFEKYSELFTKLSEIAGDNEITVEESQAWCDSVEALLGTSPPSNEEGVKHGDSVEPGKGDTAEAAPEEGTTTERSLRKAKEEEIQQKAREEEANPKEKEEPGNQ